MANEINKYRKKIDTIDNKIIKLIIKRIAVVNCVKEYKLKNNIPIYDKNREDQIFNKIKTLCNNNEDNFNYIKDVYLTILKNSKDIQKKK